MTLFKKVCSVCAAGAMLASPVIAGLNAYPAPFVENGVFDGTIVIGTGGNSRMGLAEDILVSAEIAASLAQNTVSFIDGKETISLIGSEKDIPLFDSLSSKFGASLDSEDISTLVEATFKTSEGNELDVKEKLLLDASIKVEQFEGKLGIEIPSGKLAYQLDISALDDSDSDGVLDCDDWESFGSLEFELLGKPVEIKCLTDTKLVLDESHTDVLSYGNIIEENGFKISLISVSNDGEKAVVLVEKDGASKKEVLDINQKKAILGLEVKLLSAFPFMETEPAFAELQFGEKLEKEFVSGSEWLNEDYVVEFVADGDLSPMLKLVYSPQENSVEDEFAIYDSWDYLNDFISVDNLGVTDELSRLEVSKAKESLYDSVLDTVLDSEDAIKVRFGDGMKLYDAGTDEKLDDLWLVYDGGDVVLNSRDSTGKKVVLSKYTVGDKIAYGTFKDTTIELFWNANALKVTAGGDDVILKTPVSSGNFIALSGSDGQSEATDVVADGTDIGDKEFDFFTSYGMKVIAPENSLESGDGKLVIEIPSDQQNVKVRIGKESKISEPAKIVKSALKGVIKLDTEITDEKNLILIGGPSVNKLVAELGFTKEAFKIDETPIGLIELMGDKLVVAGWDAEQTRMAGYVLANYADFALAGDKMVVSGSLSDIKVA